MVVHKKEERKMTSEKEIKAKKPSKADLLWDKIKDEDIQVFALPNQTVKDHVQRVELDPNILHLKLKASAVLPALEEVISGSKATCNEKYKFEIAENGLIAIS